MFSRQSSALRLVSYQAAVSAVTVLSVCGLLWMSAFAEGSLADSLGRATLVPVSSAPLLYTGLTCVACLLAGYFAGIVVLRYHEFVWLLLLAVLVPAWAVRSFWTEFSMGFYRGSLPIWASLVALTMGMSIGRAMVAKTVSWAVSGWTRSVLMFLVGVASLVGISALSFQLVAGRGSVGIVLSSVAIACYVAGLLALAVWCRDLIYLGCPCRSQ